MVSISDNPQTALAWRYIEQTGVSVFLTGKAGTGKTTFLQEVVRTTTKRHVVVAPTGVAAINAGGVTIHSFFQLPLDPYLPDVKELMTEYQITQRRYSLTRERLNIIRTLELLIIDEISMVRADLLDAVDMTLRRVRHSGRPFGGVQLLMIGDVHQLSPVVTDRERPFMEQVYPTPYFFASKALNRLSYTTIELTTIYRQQDSLFVEILNSIRNNHITSEVLDTLNHRVGPANPDAITLTTHNRQADAINQQHMDALQTKQHTFKAHITGDYSERLYPCPSELTLKENERVMFIKNDSSGQHNYYNGMLATIVEIRSSGEEEIVMVVDDEGNLFKARRETWENVQYHLDPQSHEIAQEVVGVFSQFPLQPAWAVTIHKAQGLTFDRVNVDAASAFAFGQVYVALSRCRTLEGLTLTSRLTTNIAFSDTSVSHFVDSQPTFEAVSSAAPQCEQNYRIEKLMELFGMEGMLHDADQLALQFGKVASLYPKEKDQLNHLCTTLGELHNVAERFKSQLLRLDEPQQCTRARQGAQYFSDQLSHLLTTLDQAMDVEIDNKETRKAIGDSHDALKGSLQLRLACLKAVVEKGYSVATVQKARAAFIAEGNKPSRHQSPSESKSKPKEKASKPKPVSVEQGLINALRKWRLEKANELNVPAFVVLHQRTLLAIAKARPQTTEQMLHLEGVGPKTVERFGEEIIGALNAYFDSLQH
ncbi:MAG: HRDC domain-containing protein [Bacteroidales bacterium]|nr:HRDC domain-containing protein [Bacteroidales bacterium]